VGKAVFAPFLVKRKAGAGKMEAGTADLPLDVVLGRPRAPAQGPLSQELDPMAMKKKARRKTRRKAAKKGARKAGGRKKKARRKARRKSSRK
jgi:hypothetical protein